MVERPGSVKMMLATPRATLMAPSTVIPTLARKGTGTSIAPSPVIGQNAITNIKVTVDLLSNGELISSDHLNLDTEGEGIFNILLSVFARWIEDGEKTNELNTLPSALLLSL